MMLQVNNLIGFGGGGLAVSYVDNGGAPPNSGTGTDTHTFNSKTTTGNASVVVISWADASSNTLSSMTFNGNSMNILVQANRATDNNVGAAICIISGAQSGDVVATFSSAVDGSAATFISLFNPRSIVAVDTDTAGAATGTGSALAALIGGAFGSITIAGYTNDTSGTSVTWTNATEITDNALTSGRHSVGVTLGQPAGDLIADGANDDHQTVGVVLR